MKVEFMTKQDLVEGRQRETNGDRPGIMSEQDPIEGRQRETNGDRPGNHGGIKSVSLQELRTPLAEAIWGIKLLLIFNLLNIINIIYFN